MSKLMTLDELADRLRLHPKTVRNAVNAGKIPAIRCGPRGQFRFDYQDVIVSLTYPEISVKPQPKKQDAELPTLMEVDHAKREKHNPVAALDDILELLPKKEAKKEGEK